MRRVAVQSTTTRPATALQLICPNCGNSVLTVPLGTETVVGAEDGETVVTLGRCPAETCAQLILTVQQGAAVLHTFPQARPAAVPAGLPARVADPLTEALECLAAGHRSAAGHMLRQTLRAVCDDLGVSGATLRDRVTALRAHVTLPDELVDGMERLHLLAAPTGPAAPDDEELTLAADVMRTILNGAYGYRVFLTRVGAFRRPPPQAPTPPNTPAPGPTPTPPAPTPAPTPVPTPTPPAPPTDLKPSGTVKG